jgi:DNA-binding response OmpR family regulator
MSEKFQREGFTVFEADNGKVGLELALKEKPEIILLDVVMPVMDGVTMLKLLREDRWGKTAKVVMLTNLNDSEEVLESLKAQAYDYLIKANWKLEDLVGLVRGKLGDLPDFKA